eukprot:gene28632-31797_t
MSALMRQILGPVALPGVTKQRSTFSSLGVAHRSPWRPTPSPYPYPPPQFSKFCPHVARMPDASSMFSNSASDGTDTQPVGVDSLPAPSSQNLSPAPIADASAELSSLEAEQQMLSMPASTSAFATVPVAPQQTDDGAILFESPSSTSTDASPAASPAAAETMQPESAAAEPESEPEVAAPQPTRSTASPQETASEQGGVVPIVVPMSKEELKAMPRPADLNEAWLTFLRVLHAGGHFTADWKYRLEVAILSKVEVKKALLHYARSRPDIIFSIPISAVATLAETEILTRDHTDRKLMNAVKRLKASFTGLSSGDASWAPDAQGSFQDLLRMMMDFASHSEAEMESHKSGTVSLLRSLLRYTIDFSFEEPNKKALAKSEQLVTPSVDQLKAIHSGRAELKAQKEARESEYVKTRVSIYTNKSHQLATPSVGQLEAIHSGRAELKAQKEARESEYLATPSVNQLEAIHSGMAELKAKKEAGESDYAQTRHQHRLTAAGLRYDLAPAPSHGCRHQRRLTAAGLRYDLVAGAWFCGECAATNQAGRKECFRCRLPDTSPGSTFVTPERTKAMYGHTSTCTSLIPQPVPQRVPQLVRQFVTQLVPQLVPPYLCSHGSTFVTPEDIKAMYGSKKPAQWRMLPREAKPTPDTPVVERSGGEGERVETRGRRTAAPMRSFIDGGEEDEEEDFASRREGGTSGAEGDLEDGEGEEEEESAGTVDVLESKHKEHFDEFYVAPSDAAGTRSQLVPEPPRPRMKPRGERVRTRVGGAPPSRGQGAEGERGGPGRAFGRGGGQQGPGDGGGRRGFSSGGRGVPPPGSKGGAGPKRRWRDEGKDGSTGGGEK